MKNNKYSIYPVTYPRLWNFYKTHEASIWHAEKIDYSQDLKDLERLSKDEMFYLTRILAFFAQSDGIVNENLAIRFYKDVEIPEARAFYTIQAFQETVHAETYSLLIDTYVKSEEEKDKLFNAIESIAVVKKKANWALKWIDSQESFAKRLLAFACVEGIFFSASFCGIYWFRKRGLLSNGLSVANDYIARDEGLHWQFAAALFQEMKLSIDKKDIEEIVKEAVEIEKEFTNDAIPVRLIGLNSDEMNKYIEHVADNILTTFGFDKIYNANNPFDFMKLINLDSQKNFFEKRVTEYQKSMDKSVSFDEDF
jgi:ribonucleoside-diphosphate reductase beta chain